MLSKEYYIGTMIYYQNLLNNMSVVTYGRHNGKEVLRYHYNDSKKLKEIAPTSKYWSKCKTLADERIEFTDRIRQLKTDYKNTWRTDINEDMARYVVTEVVKHKLNKEFWENLSDEKTSFPNDTNYYHKDDHFRSRVEVIIARILDELNLKYKYDVKITVGNNTYFADFTVYLPQFGCCFIIEYLGRLNDLDYIDDNTPKLRNYCKEGLYQGEEVLFLCGSDIRMPPAEVIQEQIAAVINAIAKRHIIKK